MGGRSPDLTSWYCARCSTWSHCANESLRARGETRPWRGRSSGGGAHWVASRCSTGTRVPVSILFGGTWLLDTPLMTYSRLSRCSQSPTWKRSGVRRSPDVAIRRRRNVIGRHIFLQCNEWDAADVLERHLDFMLSVLDRHEDVYVRVSRQPAEAVVSLRVGGAHPLSRCASRAQPGRRAPNRPSTARRGQTEIDPGPDSGPPVTVILCNWRCCWSAWRRMRDLKPARAVTPNTISNSPWPGTTEVQTFATMQSRGGAGTTGGV